MPAGDVGVAVELAGGFVDHLQTRNRKLGGVLQHLGAYFRFGARSEQAAAYGCVGPGGGSIKTRGGVKAVAVGQFGDGYSEPCQAGQ